MRGKTKHFYEFGEFRLDKNDRLLLRGSEVIPLAPKAIDLLVALVESSGQVLSKDELMKQVWPDSFVEEANLSHHIFTLRKALGEDRKGARYIETIPRRGYRFIAEVIELHDGPDIAFVQERSRSRIVIEEDTEKSDASMIEEAPAEASPRVEKPLTQALAARAAARPGWLAGNRMLAGILLVGLVLTAVAVYLFGRRAFKRDQIPVPNTGQADVASQMKITRLTSYERCIANISPDGKFICYIQNYYAGMGTLWVRQVATNKEVQLLDPGERIFNGTAFSPDSQFIYYSAIDRHNPKGALFRVPVLGGPSVRLMVQLEFMFALSPDGQQVAFYRYSEETKLKSMIIAALDGSNEQTLMTVHSPEQTFYAAPAWAPDGKRLAFAINPAPAQSNPDGDVSLYTIELATREVKPLTGERWIEIGKLIWSYDGQRIIFIAGRPRIGNQMYCLNYPGGEVRRLTSGLQEYGNYGLGITADGDTLVADGWEYSSRVWVVDADGRATDAIRLTTGVDDGVAGLTTLPDGRIVYASHAGEDLDLWVMKADGTDTKPLTADSFYERHVTATSDGRRLVFASNRAGGCHLFRMDVDGANLQQLTFGERHDETPDCSPDGQWIVYASWSGDLPTIWKVPVEGGTPIQLTDYHSIAPSFSPDGRLVSCLLPKGGMFDKGSIAIIPASGGPLVKSFQVVQFEWDYVTPRWTPDGRAVVYTEKRNSIGNLWKQPLAGGAPGPLTDFKTDYILNFAFSRDGKHIAITRGPNSAFVVSIKDFK